MKFGTLSAVLVLATIMISTIDLSQNFVFAQNTTSITPAQELAGSNDDESSSSENNDSNNESTDSSSEDDTDSQDITSSSWLWKLTVSYLSDAKLISQILSENFLTDTSGYRRARFTNVEYHAPVSIN